MKNKHKQSMMLTSKNKEERYLKALVRWWSCMDKIQCSWVGCDEYSKGDIRAVDCDGNQQFIEVKTDHKSHQTNNWAFEAWRDRKGSDYIYPERESNCLSLEVVDTPKDTTNGLSSSLLRSKSDYTLYWCPEDNSSLWMDTSALRHRLLLWHYSRLEDQPLPSGVELKPKTNTKDDRNSWLFLVNKERCNQWRESMVLPSNLSLPPHTEVNFNDPEH